MSANLLAIFYLVSGVLFILALRGLSSPETSRQGNLYGIIGMALAIGVTVLSVGNFSTGFLYLILFLLIGGSIGAFIAFKIPMTAMPELVAGFHSLVGLAAVFVDRDVSWCCNWSNNIYRINHCFSKIKRLNVRISYYIFWTTLSKSIVGNILNWINLFFMHYTKPKFILVFNCYIAFSRYFVDNPNWRCRHASSYIDA